MKLTNRTAISYSRFSSANQEGNDSLKRQRELFEQALRETGATEAPFRLSDEGLSGYKGEHLEGGDLGRFVKGMEDGLYAFPSKPVLYVERWDRLGRLKPKETKRLVDRLLRVTDILDCSDMTFYTEDFEDSELGLGMDIMLMVKIHMAYKYSKTLSERVMSAKLSQREHSQRTGEALKDRVHPNWLRHNADKTQYVEVPERVKTVKYIFELFIAGMGIAQIAQHLNENFDTYTSWGKSGVDTDKWLSGTVRSHLKNCAVYGRYEGKQAAIDNLFPVIVSKEDYDIAQLKFTKQQQKGHNTNKRNGNNILLNKARCSRCGSGMVYGHRAVPIMDCGAKRDTRCPNLSIGYKIVEEAVLKMLFEDSDISDILKIEQNKDLTGNPVNNDEAEISKLKDYIQQAEELMNEQDMPDLVLIKGVRNAKSKLAELEVNSVQVIQEDLNTLRTYKDSTALIHRLRLQEYIQSNVDSIEVESPDRKQKLISLNIKGYKVMCHVRTTKGKEPEYTLIKGIRDGQRL